MRTFITTVSAIAVAFLVAFFLGPPLGLALAGLGLALFFIIRFRLWWGALVAAVLAWLSPLLIIGGGPLWLRVVIIFVELCLLTLPAHALVRYLRTRFA